MRAAMATAMVAAALPAICASLARADDDNQQRARGHYEIGQGLYRLGDYRAAIKEFAAGYELARKPGFLVNLGQSYRKLGELGHAREMYERFLATVAAGDPKRAQVEAVLAEIAEQLRAHPELENQPPSGAGANATNPANATTAATAATAAAPPSASAAGVNPTVRLPRPERRPIRIAGLTLGAVGLGLVGGGVAFTVLADSNARDLTALDRMGGVFDGSKDSAYATDRVLAGVFFGVGGAAAATGIVLYVVGRR
jgi:hypothetical protein